MNEYVDQYGNEEEPESENPFEKSLLNYLENNLGKENGNS